MIVAGGTYFEQCEFPNEEQLWGPGLRGVCAIQNISAGQNTLYTCAGSSEMTKIDLKSSSYNFSPEVAEIPETIRYRYLHNHSNGKLSTPRAKSYGKEIGPVEGDSILRFGLIEGSVVVDGDRVVYDPQSDQAEEFHENGSDAEDLALVLNQHEAREYSGKDSVHQMLEYLTTGKSSADVAVIKCGASGAALIENQYLTKRPQLSQSEV
ncbi:hypothetical protein [Halobacterium sp. KA-6]|uniref:hypothetical protein n=1 Tax=Halobacterium sp. KA-6 TaxID=2896368 RepID=UPI001E61B98F|nr:hypothetical protein [Halobacterium sp. KA-6]MCD2204540.1 hypothetical protein [Halobacterium sp. KA-6]